MEEKQKPHRSVSLSIIKLEQLRLEIEPLSINLMELDIQAARGTGGKGFENHWGTYIFFKHHWVSINSCFSGSRLRILGKPHSREKGLLLLCGLEPWRIPHPGTPLTPLSGAIYMFRKSLFHLLLLEVKQITSINNLITSSISRARSLLKPRCPQRRTLSNSDFNTPGLTVYSA